MTRFALAGVLLAALAPAADVRRPTAPGEALKEDGFTFRLGEGAEEEVSPAVSTVAPSEALGDAETRRVLDRLPAWSAPPDEEKPVALRESSLRPPRPLRTAWRRMARPQTARLPCLPAPLQHGATVARARRSRSRCPTRTRPGPAAVVAMTAARAA